MYLSAHHVVSPVRGEGINAFYYVHGHDWDADVPPQMFPEVNPGELFDQSIAIPPPGNRVRSFLDVVAPDGASPTEIRQGFVVFVSRSRGTPLPWRGTFGRCLFHIGMDLGLVNQWHTEVAVLFRATFTVRGWGP